MSGSDELVFDTRILQISDAELEALLAESYPCILSMSRKEKGPIATPLWYEYRDGKFVLGMDAGSAKAKLLARRGRATITIQRPVEPYQYAMVEGEAHFLTDEELEARGETVWSCFRPVVARYLEGDLVDRYVAMLPILSPNYKIVEVTPKAIRGESIPRHEDVLPKTEDIPKLLQALKDGQSLADAAAGLDGSAGEGGAS